MNIVPAARVDAVRSFNRLYTQKIGLLPEGHLESAYSLVEVRVLYELAHRDAPTASAIAKELKLDPGYMSRIVSRFVRQRLVTRRRSASDARQMAMTLTAKGLATFRRLNARAADGVASVLSPLSEEKQIQMTEAMRTIELILGHPVSDNTFTLRAPRSGDFGWVVQRHGEIYAAEYGWNAEFEALVARIMAKFVESFDPARERCWIAERGGERAGCVFLVKKSRAVAQLRCLLVEPSARGLGIGRRLVDECTEFARAAGYKKIVLWTNSVLTDARRIYERAGYRIIATEPHRSFGHDLVAETWQLEL
jgi:DNA-binding MarR family transcriptional regulator/GNAT superfamily N-acetyltransferase